MSMVMRVSWIAIALAAAMVVVGVGASVLGNAEGVVGGVLIALFFGLPLLLMGLALRRTSGPYRAAAGSLAVILFAFVAMSVLGNWAYYSSSEAVFVVLTMGPTAVVCLLVLGAAVFQRPQRPSPSVPTAR